jgi:hypothetical protein
MLSRVMPLSRPPTPMLASRLRRCLLALLAALPGWRGTRAGSDSAFVTRDGWILRDDDR